MSRTPFKMKGSPMKQKKVKMVEGSTIFGQSTSEFVKNVMTGGGYGVAKYLYKKFSSEKTVVKPNVKKLQLLKKSKQKESGGLSKQTTKKYRRVTSEIKMKPPYRRPTGPRAE